MLTIPDGCCHRMAQEMGKDSWKVKNSQSDQQVIRGGLLDSIAPMPVESAVLAGMLVLVLLAGESVLAALLGYVSECEAAASMACRGPVLLLDARQR